MSNSSLRAVVGVVRLVNGPRTAKSVPRSCLISKYSSSGSGSDIGARSSSRLSTHASERHRPSLRWKLSRPIYAHHAQSFCRDARDSGCTLERRWLSNKVTKSDNDSLEGSLRQCWKCMSTIRIRDLLCKCGAAQLLDERLDYFEMFDKTPAILMDVSDVEDRFKKLQRIFHPHHEHVLQDLFATKSSEEQAISAANSAAINKAYQTLVQPMSRVKYLMNLLGSNALEEGSKENTPADASLLMEVMEIRESLEDCSSMEEAEAIMTKTAEAINVCLRGMDEVLKAGGGKDDLEDAAVRLQYLYRIEQEARAVVHRIEDAGAKPGVG